jgi:hypothetical protein
MSDTTRAQADSAEESRRMQEKRSKNGRSTSFVEYVMGLVLHSHH